MGVAVGETAAGGQIGGVAAVEMRAGCRRGHSYRRNRCELWACLSDSQLQWKLALTLTKWQYSKNCARGSSAQVELEEGQGRN